MSVYKKELRTMVVSMRFTLSEWKALFHIAKKEHISIADVIRRKLFMKGEK